MADTVLCLHHLKTPFLGFVGDALHAADVEIEQRDLRAGDPLPRLDGYAGVVSFGGEQSVTEIERYPYLEDEAEFLRGALEREVPVFGICLGGQLLAHALGGEVSRMERPIVGWRPVEALAPAGEDAVFAHAPDRVSTLHWNEDSFVAPPGAVELLTRAGPGTEAFRAGSSAWGVQFHPEADAAALDRWYAETPTDLDRAGVDIERARAADAEFLPGQAELARELFGAFARRVVDGAR
jgi:GMP synthase-like glutamine amidotransferase